MGSISIWHSRRGKNYKDIKSTSSLQRRGMNRYSIGFSRQWNCPVTLWCSGASPGAQWQRVCLQSLIFGLRRAPGGRHSNPLILKWESILPWTEETGGLQFIDSKEVDTTEVTEHVHAGTVVLHDMHFSKSVKLQHKDWTLVQTIDFSQ